MSKSSSKTLIIGCSGMLGSAFMAYSNQYNLGFIGLDYPEIDITKSTSIEVIAKSSPKVIVNCAAYTAVDKAESEVGQAFAVNSFGVSNLAKAAKETGAKLVHFSTDYVFSGSKKDGYFEEDTTGPEGIYGKSKLEGEAHIKTILLDQFLILRTAWLYGPNGKNFVDTMLKLGQERDRLKVVNDQYGCPTYTKDLVKWTMALLDLKLTGIFHSVCSGQCTWYDFAKEIFKRKNLNVVVTPVSTAEFPTPAKRPRYSVLNNEKLEKALKYKPQKWSEALSEYLNSIKL